MKVTSIKMKDVKEGANPFYTAQWSDATAEKKAEVFGIISKIQNSRITKTA